MDDDDGVGLLLWLGQWLLLVFILIPICILFYTGAFILTALRLHHPSLWASRNFVTGVVFWGIVGALVVFLWYHLSISMHLGWV